MDKDTGFKIGLVFMIIGVVTLSLLGDLAIPVSLPAFIVGFFVAVFSLWWEEPPSTHWSGTLSNSRVKNGDDNNG